MKCKIMKQNNKKSLKKMNQIWLMKLWTKWLINLKTSWQTLKNLKMIIIKKQKKQYNKNKLHKWKNKLISSLFKKVFNLLSKKDKHHILIKFMIKMEWWKNINLFFREKLKNQKGNLLILLFQVKNNLNLKFIVQNYKGSKWWNKIMKDNKKHWNKSTNNKTIWNFYNSS